jgi:hypothetical protein
MVNDDECEASGVDRKMVESITRRLNRISREMQELGLVLFGGSGSGSLRFDDGSGKGRLVLARIVGDCFDGGDGGTMPDDSGLLRGE